MSKWLPALVLAAGLLLRLPSPRVDVGQLEPVELVFLEQSDQGITLETDTGAIGRGENLEAAVAALQENAEGVVCLDTAIYLVVAGQPEPGALCQVFRPDCRVISGQSGLDWERAAVWLRVHPPQLRLSDHRAGQAIAQHLTEGEDGFGIC